MAYAPGGHGDQPDQPGAALDDDHLRQLSGIGLPSGIEGAQTCGEEVRIPSPVRVMRPDELPAAAPDFAGLGFVHPQAGGRLCPSAESGSSSGIRLRLATRTSVGKASAEAGRRSRVSPLIQKSLEARRVSGPGVQESRAREPATVVHSNPRSASSSRALPLASCSALRAAWHSMTSLPATCCHAGVPGGLRWFCLPPLPALSSRGCPEESR
jgi:hypothetical protein